jgi:hypothetical protein
MSIVITQEPEMEEEVLEGIAVCGTNLSTPVMNRSAHIDEIHYKIGNRLYIENAD